MRVSIICIGNEWQLDDGVGPAVGRCLRERFDLPDCVEVLDRAVMGYAIVPDLMACDAAIVVSFDPADVAGAPMMASLHDVRFADVLASARFMGATCEGHGFGVQVADRGDGTLERGLSGSVAAAVEPCAHAVADYLRETFGLIRPGDRAARPCQGYLAHP